MIDLRPDHLALVKEILSTHLAGIEVRAFGSRVSGKAKIHSDLDLVIIGEAAIDQKTMIHLAMAFEESDLPFRVDVVDGQTTSEAFRKIIAVHWEVVQEAQIQ